MRGEPVPRGGERKQPNPVFLAHATALTEFYVAVYTKAPQPSDSRIFATTAREMRASLSRTGKRERALAPDVGLGLLDEQNRGLLAFVEIDLGTMSHTRLRHKAALYAAYAALTRGASATHSCPHCCSSPRPTFARADS